MSATPTDLSPVAESGGGRRDSLPRNARIYFVAVAVIAAAAALPFVGRLQTTDQWPAFLILASAAATARLFVVRTPADQAYHTDIVFLIPAALILPPELLVLVAVVQMVPEWLKMRYRWYLQTFNILDYSLSAMAAWLVGRVLLLGHSGIGNEALRLSVAGLATCVVFVAVNHVLLAFMLRLARGFSLRETGLFDVEYLATDLVLAALGVAVYAFWQSNPWLVPFALTPLFLIHRSLSVPALQAEARVDSKTGLFNARHFASALSDEIGRARRFERPMSLIMADLDLLRDINNTYGHLAGDAVLKGIAEVFRAELRHYDVPARFGGEEFSILLPETPPDQALEIAERIRRAVADRTFDVETSSEPIRATVSIGVAGFPKDGTDANELIHQADLAVYRAKLQGRNRVLASSSEPLLLRADRSTRLISVPEDGDDHAPLPSAVQIQPKKARRSHRRQARPDAEHDPRFLSLGRRLSLIVGLVSAAGVSGGVIGLLLTGTSKDLLGLLTIVGLLGVGQALALQADEGSAVGTVSLELADKLLEERSTAVLESLSAAVDARDSHTAGHSCRVQQLALAIGRELGLSHAELAVLGHAALFHDIGKLTIPDVILLKPAGLTPDEWSLMQRHAEEGARIIDGVGFLNDAVPAIRHHHERFDGTGYPHRLQGDDIPLGARIIHVAGALDSMLTTRSYRAARPAAEALQELRRAAGTQFCPRCVTALERILPLESLKGDADRARLAAVAS